MAHHVLVVEDHADSAEMLAAFLRSHGHRTTIAGDAAAALEVVAKVRPTLVVVDIGLPVMDGLTLATRLRALLGDDLPIFVMSAFASAEHRQRVVDLKLNGFFAKPMNLPQLAAAVRAID
jgi:DNA-binding response OmpR family regulator